MILDQDDREEGRVRVDIGRIFSEAWDDTWRHFPRWLGVMVVVLLMLICSGVTLVGIVVVWPMIYWGVVRFLLNMTDGSACIRDLFSCYDKFGTILVVLVLWYGCLETASALLRVPQLIAVYVGAAFVGAELSTLLALAGCLWWYCVMIRFGMSVWLMIDREYGPLEALEASWEMTRGYTVDLIWMQISTLSLAVLGLLALGVGIFPVMVMIGLAWTTLYRQLSGQTDTDAVV